MRNQITVLSLDLGSSLGWSKNVCTLRPNIYIDVTDHGTVQLNELTDQRLRNEYNEVYTRTRVRMSIYEEVIRKLASMIKFDCFVTEDVFCNPTRIAAFRALVLYMETLERIVNIEHHKRLHTIPPTVIKRHISTGGHTDKIGIQEAVLANKAIKMKHPTTATEHEFDCIAGCWSFVNEFLVTSV